MRTYEQILKDWEAMTDCAKQNRRHVFKRTGNNPRIFVDGQKHCDIIDQMELVCTRCGFTKWREPLTAAPKPEGGTDE